MKFGKNIFVRTMEGKSVQFDIVKKFWMNGFITMVFSILGFLIFSLLLTEGMSNNYLQESLGISFLSREYFRLLLLFGGIGLFASVGATVVIGLPVGRTLRMLLHVIRDANEKLSRGKLDYRLRIRGYIELEEISNQFNRMAQRTEKQVESLQRLINENKELLAGAEEAASSEERRKIARELHDAISQQLFAINTTVAAIPKLMDHRPEEAKKYFKMIEKMVSMAQQELRALIMHLRPVNLEEHCLKEGIEKLLDELDMKHDHIEIHQDLHNIEDLVPGLENNIFRVTQEALSNILRHSKATKFSVKLFQKEKVLSLIIEDNGIGMANSGDKKSSYGMATMRERIEELGGRFDVISFPGKGTRIEVRVPVGLQSTFKKTVQK
jgi:two-component system, NarL family, sensor histidine kinase LiaS